MHVQNPHFEKKVRDIFQHAPFVRELGIYLQDIKPGRCETFLSIEEWHLQQDKVVHAGVLATMADHTAGAAAGSLIKEEEIVLSIEFKINFLRPAIGEKLHCLSHVLRQGKQLIAVESEVYALQGTQEGLVAKAMVTLAVVLPRTTPGE